MGIIQKTPFTFLFENIFTMEMLAIIKIIWKRKINPFRIKDQESLKKILIIPKRNIEKTKSIVS